MLDTLGGEETISKAFSHEMSISLRYQADNPYCKAVRGVPNRSTTLLMRVKRRYKRRQSDSVADGEMDENDAVSHSEYSAETVGVVGQTYNFPHLCDFQYLPYHKPEGQEPQGLIEKILPSAGEDLSYIDREVPRFMLPEAFSRFDSPVAYGYKANVQPREPQQVEPEFKSKLVHHGRLKRMNYAAVTSWTKDFKVPPGPHPGAVEHLQAQKPGDALEQLKKLFEERPLWSKNAIQGTISVAPALVKSILCAIAYYFQSGPWRGLWCRFGYDPRLHPEAKMYQLLDFRIRKELTDKRLKNLFKKKRRILLPHELSRPKKEIPTPMITTSDSLGVDEKTTKDSYFIMRRGLLPAYHQMFYQLCDLHDPELQAVINNPSWHRETANLRTGYFEPEMFTKLRNVLTNMIRETVLELEANKQQAELDGSMAVRAGPSAAAETVMRRDVFGDDDDDDEDDDEEEEEEEPEQLKDAESESENEMAMELLEFMEQDSLPI
ncbi:general transcription factor 3C polypeptide 5-like [Diadema setosum]|uniref:general transcription factor 3C polypeptide 5-like n=1 Tax=Diadema setosum TaxID=31175 RepID=UPI003B3AAD4D